MARTNITSTPPLVTSTLTCPGFALIIALSPGGWAAM